MCLRQAITKFLKGTAEIWAFIKETFLSFLEDHGIPHGCFVGFLHHFLNHSGTPHRAECCGGGYWQLQGADGASSRSGTPDQP